jgi:carbamoyltransferase
MWGARKAGDRVQQVLTDRLGPLHDSATVTQAFIPFVQTSLVTPRVVAERLARGEIVARFAGRAEFGPRALGGRSLLGSPLLETNSGGGIRN